MRGLCRTVISFFLLATFGQIVFSQTSPSAARARKIAEIDAETRPAEIKARLDSFSAAVKNEPGSRGWLYYYPGTTLAGAALRLTFIGEKYAGGRHRSGRVYECVSVARQRACVCSGILRPWVDSQTPVD